ncbi:MAG: peptidylprolyl isomerase [Burkholderiales bacterium]|jgi:FKBP-type peptidyl-prolyl cis-trans isomerase SlpA
MTVTITPHSYLTLHYRLRLQDAAGTEVVSTFEQQPATLQLGNGQLSPGLEACLHGLSEGEERQFGLQADQAFGARNPDLVQKVTRLAYDEKIDPSGDYAPGDQVPIPGPEGGYFQGVLKELTPQYALFDFNHPLAGMPVTFEVKIIGIM